VARKERIGRYEPRARAPFLVTDPDVE